MASSKNGLLLGVILALVVLAGLGLGASIRQQLATATPARPDHLRATYDPIHFQPAIAQATDAQCLACHREVLDDKPRPTSPAGIHAASSRAWYQQMRTYQGEQDTFHRRHLVTPLAQQLMNLRCTTCHQGQDVREEAPGSSATAAPQYTQDFTLRKQVNVETTCLKCHGQMNTPVMGLPGPWPAVKTIFADSCLTCHSAIRTQRHQVSYLKAEAIEAAGKDNAEVCYGCHGGRAWYRLTYPYPRHAWPGMAAEVPDWAKDRPTESEARFRLPAAKK
jgi:nitrate/TMAO reductase-like tetraheme cytochrome c subunit